MIIQPTNTFRRHLAYIEVTSATRGNAQRSKKRDFQCTLIGGGPSVPMTVRHFPSAEIV